MANPQKGSQPARNPRRLLVVASALVPLLFLTLGAIRGYPFIDDVNAETSTGHDWLNYKRYAESILHDGITLPLIEKNYARPGGILYSYFVALVFALFGENTAFVYLIQALLLGLSVVLMTWAIRDYLSPVATAAFLIAATILAYLDVFRGYTRYMLSENLLIVLVPCYYLFLFRGRDRASLWWIGLSGLFIGLATLTRPNVILIAPATTLLLFAFPNGTTRRRLTHAAVFLLAFSAAQGLLVLRNYSVTGQISAGSFSPILAETGDWKSINPESLTVYPVTSAPRGSLRYYVDRTLFSFGITRYGVVKRWVVVWAGVLLFLVLCVMRRRVGFWEAAILTFIALYLAPLIAAGAISNYAFRMILPVVLSALALAVRGGELLVARVTR
jgi:4-amino-4-deoxy-L-arabinose transferase-like glycosyltransferase